MKHWRLVGRDKINGGQNHQAINCEVCSPIAPELASRNHPRDSHRENGITQEPKKHPKNFRVVLFHVESRLFDVGAFVNPSRPGV